MHCYAYRSSRRAETYVYLPRRDDFTEIPDVLLEALGRLDFALEFELTPERRLAREDAMVVLANLERQGFHLQLPPPGRRSPGRVPRLATAPPCTASAASFIIKGHGS